MSGKQSKLLRKEIQAKHRAQQAAFRAEAERLMKSQMNMFKPKPSWVPMFLWVWVLGFFIKIKKS